MERGAGLEDVVGSPGLSGMVVLSVASGEMDEIRNGRMNNEACKQQK